MLLEGLVASLAAEYLLQPEIIWRHRKAPGFKSVLWSLPHAVVWPGVVGMACGLSFTDWRPWAALFGLHFVVDCLGVGERLMVLLRLQTIRRAVRLVHDDDLPTMIAALEFALSAATENLQWVALHWLCVLLALEWLA